MRENLYSRTITKVGSVLHIGACGVVVVLMVLTTLDVMLRGFFNRPIKGAYELSEFFLAALVFLAMARVQALKRHVRVDFLARRLPKKVVAYIDTIMYVFALGIVGLMFWQGVVVAAFISTAGGTGDPLKIPLGPVMFLAPLGFLMFFLQLVIDLARSIRPKVEAEG